MTGYKAVQKGTPYQHAAQKYRNTSVYPVNITPLHTKCSNEVLHRDDCNLAHTEINIHIASY